ncbi:MAG: hypothetical protein ABEH86_00765, partial [Haloarcula sp.]
RGTRSDTSADTSVGGVACSDITPTAGVEPDPEGTRRMSHVGRGLRGWWRRRASGRSGTGAGFPHPGDGEPDGWTACICMTLYSWEERRDADRPYCQVHALSSGAGRARRKATPLDSETSQVVAAVRRP